MKLETLVKLVVLSSVLTIFSVAHAQAPAPLDQLYPGYSPTVFNSIDDVNTLYSTMPKVFTSPGFLRAGSQCYQRAEVWTYDMYRNRQVTAMKVFVFYTAAYKEAYKQLHNGQKFIWWFHVAPYVLYKDANGQTTESVLDPSFAYLDPTYAATNSEGPLTMPKWSELFVETGMPCKEWVRYEDFKAELTTIGTEQCYLVRVPATDFGTDDVEARDLGQITGYDWNLGEVKDSINKATVMSEKSMLMQRLGF